MYASRTPSGSSTLMFWPLPWFRFTKSVVSSLPLNASISHAALIGILPLSDTELADASDPIDATGDGEGTSGVGTFSEALGAFARWEAAVHT
jgi:hypothetical protein